MKQRYVAGAREPMTDHIPTQSISTTGQHALSLAAGDRVFLNSGIVLSANGAGVDGIRSSGTDNHISLRSGSHVASQMGTGILLYANSQVSIATGASVSGQSYGMHFNVSSPSSQTNTLLNYGSISGGKGVKAGVNDKAAEEKIVNYGSILGTNDIAVELYGAASVINHGRIEGSTGGISLANSPFVSRTIINTGSIVGHSKNAITFTGATFGDVVVNTGRLVGGIAFGSQSSPYIVGDLYDGRGGSVTGLIYLNSGNDRAYGGAGAETFEGWMGNDTIDGGGGNDTILFNANRSQYDISTAGGVTTVVSKGTPATDTDTLTNVRFLKFADTTEILYNTGPSGLALTQTAFAENTLVNTPLARVTSQDAEGDAITYTLLDPSGTFKLDQGNLVLVKALDYETRTSYAVTLEARDAYGAVSTQTLTLSVTDVGDTPSNPGDPSPPVDAPLVLRGTAGANTLAGRGNNDILSGLSGKDGLYGNGGNDKLSGGLGNDTLSGGTGSDIFVFDAKLSKTNRLNKQQNLDRITDFSVADDTIHLTKGVFTKIAKKGVLAGSAFYASTKGVAHDASDRIVYNKKTGALFYDKDGSGAAEAIQIATLSSRLGLTSTDFFVI
jgi:Ca2+-binding RTX toxin-like protein